MAWSTRTKVGSFLHVAVAVAVLAIGLAPWIVSPAARNQLDRVQVLVSLAVSVFCLGMAFWMASDWYRLRTTVLAVENGELRLAFRKMVLSPSSLVSLVVPLEDILEISLSGGLGCTGLPRYQMDVLYRAGSAGGQPRDSHEPGRQGGALTGQRVKRVQVMIGISGQELAALRGRLRESRPGLPLAVHRKDWQDLKKYLLS